MSWQIGDVMTAYDIQADGGPFPEDGETAEHYYNRVIAWGVTKYYDIRLNIHNQLIFFGYLPGYEQPSSTGHIITYAVLGTGIVALAYLYLKERKEVNSYGKRRTKALNSR